MSLGLNVPPGLSAMTDVLFSPKTSSPCAETCGKSKDQGSFCRPSLARLHLLLSFLAGWYTCSGEHAEDDPDQPLLHLWVGAIFSVNNFIIFPKLLSQRASYKQHHEGEGSLQNGSSGHGLHRASCQAAAVTVVFEGRL